MAPDSPVSLPPVGAQRPAVERDVQALLLLLRSKSPDHAAQLAATVEVVNKSFVRVLRLSEPIDTGQPLSIYGIDSLAAVEVRNWLRAELEALVTTLDILNASSLITLCEKVVAKVTSSYSYLGTDEERREFVNNCVVFNTKKSFYFSFYFIPICYVIRSISLFGRLLVY